MINEIIINIRLEKKWIIRIIFCDYSKDIYLLVKKYLIIWSSYRGKEWINNNMGNKYRVV